MPACASPRRFAPLCRYERHRPEAGFQTANIAQANKVLRQLAGAEDTLVAPGRHVAHLPGRVKDKPKGTAQSGILDTPLTAGVQERPHPPHLRIGLWCTQHPGVFGAPIILPWGEYLPVPDG
jgi:hypothetical protein